MTEKLTINQALQKKTSDAAYDLYSFAHLALSLPPDAALVLSQAPIGLIKTLGEASSYLGSICSIEPNGEVLANRNMTGLEAKTHIGSPNFFIAGDGVKHLQLRQESICTFEGVVEKAVDYVKNVYMDDSRVDIVDTTQLLEDNKNSMVKNMFNSIVGVSK